MFKNDILQTVSSTIFNFQLDLELRRSEPCLRHRFGRPPGRHRLRRLFRRRRRPMLPLRRRRCAKPEPDRLQKRRNRSGGDRGQIGPF